MNLKANVSIHNKFDIKVRDITTGEVIQEGIAENILLDNIYPILHSPSLSSPSNTLGKYMFLGDGTGTLVSARTSLFSSLGYKATSVVETVYNTPPIASYCKRKVVILSDEQVGKTITEVGLSANGGSINTHALIKDVEGNPISIGPKTDTQEITIYATTYAKITIPNGLSFGLPTVKPNIILARIFGLEDSTYYMGRGYYMQLTTSTSKLSASACPYTQGDLYWSQYYYFNNQDATNRILSTGRKRLASAESNGKIWSIYSAWGMTTGEKYPIWHMVFPNDLWSGYQFLGKTIGTGDGSKTKFILPWSDINTIKEYKIYIDGALKAKDIDYTLANSVSETSVTFTSAPVNGAVITGDWWVDYIPKDNEHLLDITISIQFGEGE